jgi:hypothetical protein
MAVDLTGAMAHVHQAALNGDLTKLEAQLAAGVDVNRWPSLNPCSSEFI